MKSKLLLTLLGTTIIAFGGLSAHASSELSGLDSQQRELLTQEGPKDGGAIVVKEEMVIPNTTIDMTATPLTPTQQSNLDDIEAQENFDEIQNRLHGAIDPAAPTVDPVSQPDMAPAMDDATIVDESVVITE